MVRNNSIETVDVNLNGGTLKLVFLIAFLVIGSLFLFGGSVKLYFTCSSSGNCLIYEKSIFPFKINEHSFSAANGNYYLECSKTKVKNIRPTRIHHIDKTFLSEQYIYELYAGKDYKTSNNLNIYLKPENCTAEKNKIDSILKSSDKKFDYVSPSYAAKNLYLIIGWVLVGLAILSLIFKVEPMPNENKNK